MPQSTLLSYFSGSGVKAPSAFQGPTYQPKIELPRSRFSHASVDSSTGARDHFASSAVSAFKAAAPSGNFLQSSPEMTTHLSLIPHAPELALSTVQPAHLPPLKRLTSTLLPIRYPDSFFNGAIDNEDFAATFSRVALYFPSSLPVGWIRCRLEPFPEPTSPPSNTKAIYNQIYIQALCLLAPYRGLGVAAALLESIIRQDVLMEHNIHFIYAHVWECNDEALEWYKKRGFTLIIMVENYYRKLRPGGAWIVRKDLT